MTNDYKHPSENFLRTIDVHSLLPQQEPFVMIDHLIGYSDEDTVTQTTVMADNIFVENGVFTEGGLMENIAQTCAARIGYNNIYILKKGIQIGVIGEVKGMKIVSYPRVGDVITTRLHVVTELFGMTLASATVTCNGQEVVTSKIKLAVK